MRIWTTAVALAIAAPAAAEKPDVSLYAFECGRLMQDDLGRFSDTFHFQGEKREFVAGCYLIRHPKGLMLWDTGLTPDLIGATGGPPGMTIKQSIPDRLKAIGVTPDRIAYVGISHHHADHTGGARDFPNAELLIGRGDIEALKAMKPDDRAPKQLAHWLSGGGKLTPLTGDKDVFGDGSVTILTMPGHTPGHSALLVRLASGNVLLSGDEYHFRENRPLRGVPTFNWNRADTLASHDRFEAIAKQLKARVIIQHDPRDLAELAAFPAALK